MFKNYARINIAVTVKGKSGVQHHAIQRPTILAKHPSLNTTDFKYACTYSIKLYALTQYMFHIYDILVCYGGERLLGLSHIKVLHFKHAYFF